MAVAPDTQQPKDKSKLKQELDNDDRDVAELWGDALKSYKGIVGFDLQPQFANVQAMIDFGGNEMGNFHKFRHNEKKVDKLRSLFAKNLDFIEKGAQQLISAATPAFPPAAAIGTAITYMLKACRAVSADYDIVMVFFEDMNSFLQRIVILETRLPKYKAYRNCLMDVFTSFLTMCGFATKFIELGRFKKWISTLMNRSDGDLGGARKTMDLKLSRLQHATELAILGNSVEQLKMTSELQQNSDEHTQMLEEQKGMLNAVLEGNESIRNDMAKLLQAFEAQRKEATGTSKTKGKAGLGQGKPPSANRIRNALPEVEGELSEYHILKETIVPDTCSWIFSQAAWESWVKAEDGSRSLLGITGPPGAGKSHLGASVYDRLAKMAQDDAEHHTCAAHFYFREERYSLAAFGNAIVTVINQIAEKDAQICEKLFAQLSKDDVEIDVWQWRDLMDKLLAVVFEENSKERLLLMLDGIDELRDTERALFHEFLGIIKTKKLRISLVITSRPEALKSLPDQQTLVTIEATRERQLPDLKALIWDRLNSKGALRKFSRYVKQRIADKVEEAAPNMLYAEHMLVRYNNLGREGAVIKDIDKPMPPNLHALYENLLTECHRRTATNRQEIVATLLRWLAFSFRPLILVEVNSLLKYLSQDQDFDLDEIPEPFTKFLRIGDPVDEGDTKSTPTFIQNVQQLEKTDNSPDKNYNDSGLPIKFRERSMRSFFREGPQVDGSLKVSASQAQREIFLTCSKLADKITFVVDYRMQYYAIYFITDHWLQINPDEHTPEENTEVMEAFGAMLLNPNNHFARMMEWAAGAECTKVFSDAVFQKAALWAKLADGSGEKEVVSGLSEAVLQWWKNVAQDNRRLLAGLIRGHVKRIYEAANIQAAQKSYAAARAAIERSHLGDALAKQAVKNFGPNPAVEKYLAQKKKGQIGVNGKLAILGIPGLFQDVDMDSTAYRAIAELLRNYHHMQPALLQSKIALERSKTSLEKCRALSTLASVQLRLRQTSEAKATINESLVLLTSETEGMTPDVKREALVTKARIEVKLGDMVAAASSFQAAKEADPANAAPGDVLQEEVAIFDKTDDYHGMIAVLKKWKPLERLVWLTWNYDDEGDDRRIRFTEVAARTGEADFMVQTYQEAIAYLDNVSAGAPLRIDLALAHKQVRGDLEAARKTLDEVMESNSTGWAYDITEELPDYTLERAINAQTDVLFDLFRQSSDPKAKMELLAAVKGLTQRPLALDVPPGSVTFLLHHMIITARMVLKMGAAEEFQKGIQKVIKTCVEALDDDVGWNDSINLHKLAEALAVLGRALGVSPVADELRWAASMVLSARFSKLDPVKSEAQSNDNTEDSEGSDDEEDDSEEEDDEDEDEESEDDDDEKEEEQPPTNEGDLMAPDDALWICDGICNPAVEFRWWGDRVAYQCTTCADGWFCEACYHALQLDLRGEKRFPGRRLCGQGHEFIKAPVEGWQGVKDGVVVLKAGQRYVFGEFLDKVQNEICKNAWEEFWTGD